MFLKHLWNMNFAYIPCISLRTSLCWLSLSGNPVISILFLDFVNFTINKQGGMVIKISIILHTKNARVFLFRALCRFYDSLAENVPTSMFASDWLGSLIHIHRNRRVSLFSNCLLTRKTCCPAAGQFYSWRKKKLDAGTTWHLERSSYSVTIKGKHCCWKTIQ